MWFSWLVVYILKFESTHMPNQLFKWCSFVILKGNMTINNDKDSVNLTTSALKLGFGILL